MNTSYWTEATDTDKQANQIIQNDKQDLTYT